VAGGFELSDLEVRHVTFWGVKRSARGTKAHLLIKQRGGGRLAKWGKKRRQAHENEVVQLTQRRIEIKVRGKQRETGSV